MKVTAKLTVKASFADNKTDEEVKTEVESMIPKILGSNYPVVESSIKYEILRESEVHSLTSLAAQLHEANRPDIRADIFNMLKDYLQKAINDGMWVSPKVAQELRDEILEHEDSQVVMPLAYDVVKQLNIILDQDDFDQTAEALEWLGSRDWSISRRAEGWMFTKENQDVFCSNKEELLTFRADQQNVEENHNWNTMDSAPRDRYVLVTGYIGNDPDKDRYVTRAKWSYGNWYQPGNYYDHQRLHPPTHWKETGTLPR
jgi:hypothetical protein